MKLLSYAKKRVVVTGCFSGIGRSTAELLVEGGAEVHGFDITANALEMHSFTKVDLRSPESIAAAVKTIRGPVDALFNCAGLAPGHPPLDVLKVNFIGLRYLTDLLCPLMPSGSAVASVASNGGAAWASHLPSLLQLAETVSFDAAAHWCEQNSEALERSYSVSKEAVIVWTMLAAARLIHQGIRVNCISPGAVQTPMLEEIEKVTPSALIDMMALPIGRRSRPEEQAHPLLFLNSAAASYLNGVVLPVDGGFLAARTTNQIETPAQLGSK